MKEIDREAIRRDPPAILSAEECAAYLGLGLRTIHSLARSGRLPGSKVGGSWRFPTAAIDEAIARAAGKNEGRE